MKKNAKSLKTTSFLLTLLLIVIGVYFFYTEHIPLIHNVIPIIPSHLRDDMSLSQNNVQNTLETEWQSALQNRQKKQPDNDLTAWVIKIEPMTDKNKALTVLEQLKKQKLPVFLEKTSDHSLSLFIGPDVNKEFLQKTQKQIENMLQITTSLEKFNFTQTP